MNRTVSRTVRINLVTDHDDGAIIRLLKALLKALLRTYGVRCSYVTMEPAPTEEDERP